MSNNHKAYALAEDHWNVHSESYYTVWTAFREKDMNGITDPNEIATALLKTFIGESHMRHNGEPMGWDPQHGEYLVRIYEIDPAILIEDPLGDESLPDGFQPNSPLAGVALFQVSNEN